MNKTLITLSLILIAAMSANAQEFNQVKVGLGFGYASPADGGGGICLYLEPGYRINDQISVQLRLESAAMAKVVDGNQGTVTANGSYTVNGQYYFGTNKVRAYAGLGLGLYGVANASVSSSGGGQLDGGSVLGFYPRVGVDVGHFNFLFDYNIVGSSPYTANNGEEFDVKNSYFTLKAGFTIGGGKK